MTAIRLMVGIVLCLVVFVIGQYLVGIESPFTQFMGLMLKICGGLGAGFAIAEYRGDLLNNGY